MLPRPYLPYFRVETDMKRRILLVDDEMAILLTLRAILEMNGFEVETAASGREAISKLQNGGQYHMVITDLKMENETAGHDVIRAAKHAENNPAVAILTAYPSLGSGWKSEGADSMLVKPMNTEDLLRQIEVLLIQHEDEKQRLQRVARPGNARKDVAKRAS
jgi:DNA-binding response OmpR family regulator